MPAGSFPSTDFSVLRLAQAGGDDAWRRLVSLYGPLVQGWCRRDGLRDADLDDVFQEVVLTVASRLSTFRRDRAGDTFRGWLRLIARSKIVDHARRASPARAVGGSEAHGRLQNVPAAPAAQSSAATSAAASNVADDAADKRRLTSRALQLLKAGFDDKTWQAFWRTTVETANSTVVARELGMTPNAVRKAKVRVLQKLRAEFGEVR